MGAWGKVRVESNGQAYCAQCGHTRDRQGELFKGRQSVVAHLKYCKGPDGLNQQLSGLQAQLDGGRPVPPLPAEKPQGISRQPAGSLLGSAMPKYAPSPGLGGTLLRALPAVSPGINLGARVTELEAQLAAARDRATLAEEERDRAFEIAQTAVTAATNEVVHIEKPVNYVPWVIGGGLVLAVGYWIYSVAKAPEPRRGGIGMGDAGDEPRSGLGRVADKVVNKVVDKALGKALSLVF